MDAVGLGLSAISLSVQLFGGCVTGFTLLSTARNFGKDASFLQTMLSVEEYRFLKWADAVGLTGPEGQLLPQLNQSLAEELMVQLRDRLDCSKLRERYLLDVHLQPDDLDHSCSATEASSSPVPQTTASDILASAVSDDRRRGILARAKLVHGQKGLSKRLWWAAIDKSRFQDLVRDLRQIIDALWNLLEPIRLKGLSQQVTQTLTAVVDMSHDIESLKGLRAILSRASSPVAQSDESLASAVGLKIVREQLPSENADQQLGPATASEALRPLSRTLLRRPTNKPHPSGPFVAEYDGRPVICETKAVQPRLKSKLRIRAENLARLLSIPKGSGFLTLRCLGLLEDMDEFIFVYEYPAGADASSPPRSLQDQMRDSASRAPSVTARLQLALQICRTVLTVNTAGWLHKNIRSENILFFRPADTTAGSADPLPCPFIGGFAFSRADSPVEVSDQASDDPLLDIYRHPQGMGEPSVSYCMYMDHYSLGMVLAEIAEWRPLKHIIRKHVDVTKREVDVPLSALAGIHTWFVREMVGRGHVDFRMGDMYGRLVAWLTRPVPGGSNGQQLLAFQQLVNCLESCQI
ncbi:prion-inhibition and propagation-domain-containing protein [Aspergillus recurvatus]